MYANQHPASPMPTVVNSSSDSGSTRSQPARDYSSQPHRMIATTASLRRTSTHDGSIDESTASRSTGNVAPSTHPSYGTNATVAVHAHAVPHASAGMPGTTIALSPFHASHSARYPHASSATAPMGERVVVLREVGPGAAYAAPQGTLASTAPIRLITDPITNMTYQQVDIEGDYVRRGFHIATMNTDPQIVQQPPANQHYARGCVVQTIPNAAAARVANIANTASPPPPLPTTATARQPPSAHYAANGHQHGHQHQHQHLPHGTQMLVEVSNSQNSRTPVVVQHDPYQRGRMEYHPHQQHQLYTTVPVPARAPTRTQTRTPAQFVSVDGRQTSIETQSDRPLGPANSGARIMGHDGNAYLSRALPTVQRVYPYPPPQPVQGNDGVHPDTMITMPASVLASLGINVAQLLGQNPHVTHPPLPPAQSPRRQNALQPSNVATSGTPHISNVDVNRNGQSSSADNTGSVSDGVGVVAHTNNSAGVTHAQQPVPTQGHVAASRATAAPTAPAVNPATGPTTPRTHQTETASDDGRNQTAATQSDEQVDTDADGNVVFRVPDAPAGTHPPVIVYMPNDEDHLSEYQCMLRQQVEFFEATPNDLKWNMQGRNIPIVIGQVGIRCRYCAKLPTWSRARGAVYYSANLAGLYQAAQNMSKNHLCKHCRLLPADIKKKLTALRRSRRRAGGGKCYWAEGATKLGIVQTKDGLRFATSVNNTSTIVAEGREGKQKEK